MSERIIQENQESSFSKKLFFNYRVNRALKDCYKIKTYLYKSDYLNRSDNKLNLIITDGFNNQVKNSYFLYKGYTENGSISPIKTYTIINGEIVKHTDVIKQDIIILDLYEKSIYLHSYTKDNDYITGYLIEEVITSKRNKTLLFSNKKIRINSKNVNKIDTTCVVDDFVNKFIM